MLKFKKWTKISLIIIFIPSFFLYLSLLLGIAFEDHYDVKKGTFLWYATMDNETITNFPLLEISGNPTYNKIGGDSPNIASGWEIKYSSEASKEVLESKVLKYLNNSGFKITSSTDSQYGWEGVSNKGEGLYLSISGNTISSTIFCQILY